MRFIHSCKPFYSLFEIFFRILNRKLMLYQKGSYKSCSLFKYCDTSAISNHGISVLIVYGRQYLTLIFTTIYKVTMSRRFVNELLFNAKCFGTPGDIIRYVLD